MDDLTRIAINDMKHELCDMRPCRDCAKFKYQVFNGDTILGTYYGDSIFDTDAFRFASDLAKNLKTKIRVDVFDRLENSTETSCHYEFYSGGLYKKVG